MLDLIVKEKKAILWTNLCPEKCMNTSLKDLSAVMNNHGRHG